MGFPLVQLTLLKENLKVMFLQCSPRWSESFRVQTVFFLFNQQILARGSFAKKGTGGSFHFVFECLGKQNPSIR